MRLDKVRTDMRRRDLIAALGCSAVAWPGVLRAQQGKPKAIGYLSSATLAATRQWVVPFEQRLRELGWTEPATVSIDYRWAEGRPERLRENAIEFVRQTVDVIFTHGTPGVLAAKQASTAIPVVFVLVGDPVGIGAVASLARPGGNITGLSNQLVDVATKRLELLKEVVPKIRRLAIFLHSLNPTSVLEREEVRKAASSLGIDVVERMVQRREDIQPAFVNLTAVDAMYVCGDPLVFSNLALINSLAAAGRLPTIHASREFLSGGGLLSYGPSVPDLFRRGAAYIDKILRGAKASDLPVEQPTKFEMVIDLKLATAIGLTIPAMVLAPPDEVIE